MSIHLSPMNFEKSACIGLMSTSFSNNHVFFRNVHPSQSDDLTKHRNNCTVHRSMPLSHTHFFGMPILLNPLQMKKNNCFWLRSTPFSNKTKFFWSCPPFNPITLQRKTSVLDLWAHRLTINRLLDMSTILKPMTLQSNQNNCIGLRSTPFSPKPHFVGHVHPS